MAVKQQQQRKPDPRARGPATAGQELLLVRKTVDSLQIALKTSQLFPRGNVNVKTTLDNFEKALEAFFKATDEALTLDVTPGELLYRGEPVFTESGRTRRTAQAMSKDGVSQLLLHPGVEPKELSDLLDVLHAVLRLDEQADDFVTLLWEKDCIHIQAVVRDARASPASMPDIPSREQLGQMRFSGAGTGGGSDAGSGGKHEGARAAEAQGKALANVKKQILPLTEEEKQRLAQQVQRDADTSPVLELCDVLFMVWQADPTFETFEQVVRVLCGTIASLLGQEAFAAARALAEDLTRLSQRQELSDRHRRAVNAGFESLGEGEAIKAALAHLEQEGREVVDEDLLRYLGHLRANALDALMKVYLGGRHCQALLPVLEAIGRGHAVPGLDRAVQSERPEVALRAVELAARVARAQLAPYLQQLLQSHDGRLRAKSLAVALEADDDETRELAQHALLDPEREVRAVALHALDKRPFPQAFAALWEMFKDRARRCLSESELQLALCAAARCDPDLTAKMAAPWLERGAWLKKSRKALEDNQRVLVLALARSAHPLLREQIDQHARGSGFVAKLCQMALASRQREGARSGGQP